MSDIAIKVENISKKYQIGENKKYPTLRDKLVELPSRLFKGPQKTKEFWALKDVSFEVKKGEVVGIIGRNGAGKSTMLKILARITEPTTGKITMHGRVASMLEVGTGFNPELTGRENIYLNGAIIGMTNQEIVSKFDDIVEFSGVGKFLDTPVKHYSSGMYVRLAFAVAAHLDADILLVDEVLAVGDAEFQKKCLGKMSDLAGNGKTVIFVSHNTRAILDLCSKIVYLQAGEVQEYGQAREVISHYIHNSRENYHYSFSGPLSKIILITDISINKNKHKITSLLPTEDINIVVKGNCIKNINDIRITLSIYSNDVRLFSLHDTPSGQPLKKGQFTSTFSITGQNLRPGEYDVYVGGHQVETRDWFYGEQLHHFVILPVWSKMVEEVNIGLINISGETRRE